MTTSTITPCLIDEIQRSYAVGPHFAAEYLRYWQEARGCVDDSLAQIMERPDPEPLWFDYAMSTNERARDFYRQFAPYLGDRPGRYLDVGCGFGGCLLAFAEQGFEVCGIEVAPERVRLSRANCRDVGLIDCVYARNILDDDLLAQFGTFDAITCLDVIEHVLDVPRAMRNMADLLRPGGVLILEIPNRDSVPFVVSDGHFNLFGITQLTRKKSIEYHRAFFDFEYDVGYYRPLHYYVNFLSGLGLECQAMGSPLHPFRAADGLSALLGSISVGYRAFRESRAPKLSRRMNATIRWRAACFAARLIYNGVKRKLGVLETDLFRQRFLADFWTVLARRPAGGLAGRARSV